MALTKIPGHGVNVNATANGQVQFNDAGILDGSANLTFNQDTNTLFATNFSGNGSLLTGIVAPPSATAGTVTTNAQPNITSVGTLSSVIVSGTANLTSINLSGNIIPTISNTYSLGSETFNFKDVYIGPGSLYINGSKVLEEVSNAIIFTADLNQSVRLTTSGTGDIQLLPTGTGVVSVQGPLQVLAGANITSSNGGKIGFSNPIGVDSITTLSANTELVITGNGSGNVKVDDDLIITGNLTLQGTTGNLSVTTLSVQDNIIDISAETTGAPTSNAGIRVVRGDESATLVRWTESLTSWQFTNDGTNYLSMVGRDSVSNISLGNIALANFFVGNGSQLTGLTVSSIAGPNVTGTVANATYALTAGTVVTNAQPNITSVGTLTSLSVTGNIVAGNISTSGSGGNITGANVITANVFTATGNVTGNFFIGNGSQLTGISTSTSTVFNGNSNVNIATAGANVTVSVTNTSNVVVVTSTGVNVAGTLTATGNIIAGNISTSGSGGNITGANVITANFFSGNGNSLFSIAGANVSGAVSLATFATTANSVAGANVSGTVANATYAITSGTSYSVSGANVSGAVSLATFATTANAVAGANVSGEVSLATFATTANAVAGANVTGTVANATYAVSAGSATTATTATTADSATTAGTVTTAAQSNITSVGSLTALTVTGNVTLSGANVSLGSVGNLHIAGGTANYVLSTDGIGNLSWVEAAAGAGSTSTYETRMYTGNSVQNTFTVTTGVTVDSLIVTENGIVQTPTTDYTVSGSNLIFTLAPDTDVVIQVRELSGAQAFVAGTNTQVQFNNAGNFGASAGLTFNSSTTALTANNFVATSTANLGAVGNVTITGGTAAYVLSTDGTGNLSWVEQSGGGGTPGGANTQVQFNDSTTFGGDAGLTFNKTTTTLTANNLIATSSANLGNLVTANFFSGSGNLLSNIQGANVSGEVAFAATANAVAGTNVSGQVSNALVSGTVYTAAQPNITSTGTLTSLTVSGTTNLGAVGNLTITGGTANYVLSTNGSGSLSWVAQSGGGGSTGISEKISKSVTSQVGYAVTSTLSAALTLPATAGLKYIIHSIYVTNIDAAFSSTVTVSGTMLFSATSTTVSISNKIPVPARGALELLRKPQILNPSDVINLQAFDAGVGANNDLQAIITYETVTTDLNYFGTGVIAPVSTASDMYVSTGANSVIDSIRLVNYSDLGNIAITLSWTDGSNAIQAYLTSNLIIPQNSSIELCDNPKRIPTGHKIRAFATTGTAISVFISGRTQ